MRKQQTKKNTLRAQTNDPIRDRVVYLVEYLYGGNVTAFSAAIDVPYAVVWRSVTDCTVAPVILVNIVAKLGVSGSWLLTGALPLFQNDQPDIEAVKIKNRYALFNQTTIRPRQKQHGSLFVRRTNRRLFRERLANNICKARTNNAPVIVVFDHTLTDGFGADTLISFLRKDLVTALATSTAGLQADLCAPELFEQAVEMSACWQTGLGEAAGRVAQISCDLKASVVATAYDLNVPTTVHAHSGDTPAQFSIKSSGDKFAARLGSASFIDLLLFTEQIRLFRNTKHGICIILTKNQSLNTMLFNAVTVAQSTTTKRYGLIYEIDVCFLRRLFEECQRILKGHNSAN